MTSSKNKDPQLQINSPENMSLSEKAFADKYPVCWGIAVEQFAANAHAMASLLYKALYDPKFFREHEEQFGSDTFKDRIIKLTSPGIEGPPPEEEEFVTAVLEAVRGIDFSQCTYPQALDQLRAMMGQGSVAIWTAGDTLGMKDYMGSMMQHRKVAAVGINSLRTQVAAESGQRRRDTLRVLASEDKFSEETLQKVREIAEGRIVFVLEDRLKNILKLQRELPDVDLRPIWVQQDKHGRKVPKELADTDPDELVKRFGAVDSIAKVASKVAGMLSATDKSALFLVDFDGVISNDTKRAQLQEEAIGQALKQRGWV